MGEEQGHWIDEELKIIIFTMQEVVDITTKNGKVLIDLCKVKKGMFALIWSNANMFLGHSKFDAF